MHDSVNLERKGIPTVVISNTVFEGAARIQAQILGLPSVRIVTVPPIAPGDSSEVLRKRAEDVLDALVAALTRE